MAPPKVPSFLANPMDGDYPSRLHRILHKSHFCKLTFGKTVSGRCQFVMESQQPRLAFTLRTFKQGQIIFTAEYCQLDVHFMDAKSEILAKEHQHELQGWLKDSDEVVIFEIISSSRPAMPAVARTQPSDSEEATTWSYLNDPELNWIGQRVLIWMQRSQAHRQETNELVQWMCEYIALIRAHPNEGRRLSHWFCEWNKVVTL